MATKAKKKGSVQQPPVVRRERRGLSNVGGKSRVQALNADDGDLVRGSFDVAADEDATRAHIHGFHSYPARVHPLTAQRLISGLSQPGQLVVDPFCGSGTTLVEAGIASRRVVGSDLSPLAIELSWLKTLAPDERVWTPVLRAAQTVIEVAEERRAKKAGPTRRYGREDMDLFDIHVLLELDSLRAGIDKGHGSFVERCLSLVLSSILIKVSRQGGDSSELRAPKRIAAGFATRLFGLKLEELTRRIEEFRAELPSGYEAPRLKVADARRLPHLKPHSVRAMVCSPPYPGVYDYAHQHAVRMRWLGLKAPRFVRSEMSARRHLRDLDGAQATARWKGELLALFKEARRVLSRDGAMALVLGDGVAHGDPVIATVPVREVAEQVGFDVAAIASQRRKHVHHGTRTAFAGRPREEHLILLRPSARFR